MTYMVREYGERRRESTVRRDNMVHRVYREVMAEIGEYARYVSRSVIYDKIKEKTGLCRKTIAGILNHSREVSRNG